MITRIPQPVARERAERAAEFLSRDPRVRLIFLFGSAATGAASVTVGDVDLGVVFDPPVELAERLRLQADVGAEAGPGIEVVPLERAPVALAREVADTGICLFSRDPQAEVEFVTRARARAWDFAPFLETQWRYAGERLAARRNGSPS